MRSVRLSSASFSGRPKFCSSNVFRNSGPTGSGISSATIFSPVANAWPALSARDDQVERLGELLLERRAAARVRLTLQER